MVGYDLNKSRSGKLATNQYREMSILSNKSQLYIYTLNIIVIK